MSDIDTRSVAEIMWTSKPCCNVEDNNGHCADDCRIWTSPDGLRWEYGSTLNVEVTPDDMLAWLAGQEVDGQPLWPDVDTHDAPDSYSVWVNRWDAEQGGWTLWKYAKKRETLHAALEAAVRAVAEAE